MAKRDDLGQAKAAKKDEFYTQLTDIEKEMRYYRKHFKNKTVFCNCDDPFESNFFKYSPDQFEIIALGHLKDNFTPNKTYINPKKHRKDGSIVSGESLNSDLAYMV